MQTICKCMLFHGLYSIQIEQAAYFLRAPFSSGLLWCTQGKDFKELDAVFPSCTLFKTNVCTKERANPHTRLFLSSRLSLFFFLQVCPSPRPQKSKTRPCTYLGLGLYPQKRREERCRGQWHLQATIRVTDSSDIKCASFFSYYNTLCYKNTIQIAYM